MFYLVADSTGRLAVLHLRYDAGGQTVRIRAAPLPVRVARGTATRGRHCYSQVKDIYLPWGSLRIGVEHFVEPYGRNAAKSLVIFLLLLFTIIIIICFHVYLFSPVRVIPSRQLKTTTACIEVLQYTILQYVRRFYSSPQRILSSLRIY